MFSLITLFLTAEHVWQRKPYYISLNSSFRKSLPASSLGSFFPNNIFFTHTLVSSISLKFLFDPPFLIFACCHVKFFQAFTRLCSGFWGLFGHKLLCLAVLDEVIPLVSQSVDQSPGLVWATTRPILGELERSQRQGQAQRAGYQATERKLN